MASSSSSSTSTTKYHVFLSFRGEDTRVGFTSHLHAALESKSIITFIDNDLKRGEEISPSLVKAIEDSVLSMIIFSEQYASSRWCLYELVKILECRSRGQIVIPIFYKVDPSHVRNQIGSFGYAFAELVTRKALEMEEERRFRAALNETANISGHDSRNMVSESEFIEEIVKDILNKLSKMIPIHPMNLVGIDERIREIESVLEMELKDVRIVGIWGMGGIGKTTIAGAVYNKICTEFEAFLFVSNVREELTRRTVVDLQRSFVSRLLDQEIRDMGPLNFGNHFVQDGLRHTRVLIVFDDVDSSMPLQELLLGQHDSFGPGSRILVTSRDRHVLEQVVNATYEVKPLNSNEALQLLISKAFKKFDPTSDHQNLLWRVVDYAKGNPLALKVLGSALRGQSKEYWNSKLNGLGQGLDVDILKVLKISYDGLTKEEKETFLDIAFFFRGTDRYHVTRILEKKRSSVYCWISNLIDKSLITTTFDNKLAMHDLLREMAYGIVNEESKSPRKRSRLVDPEDIYHVLKKRKGRKAVKGICLDLDMPESREMQLESFVFKGMGGLEFLIIKGNTRKVKLPCGGFEYLPEKLRYFRWDGYPSTSLAQEFCAKNLVDFDFSDSKVKELWSGRQELVNLRRIDLTRSHCLTKLPDLSEAKKLQHVFLGSCSSLIEVPSYFEYFDDLETLHLGYCHNLQSLPRKINSYKIRDLILVQCFKIKKSPEIPANIKRLGLNGTAIEEVQQSFGGKYSSLELEGCSNITKFPTISGNLESLNLDETAIEEVPSSIQFHTSLMHLSLKDCKKLFRLPISICELKSLRTLDISGCSKLQSFPEIKKPMKFLRELVLSETTITELPSSIQFLTNLRDLRLKDCKKLFRLSDSICELKSLETLDLSGCSKLQSFPEIKKPTESFGGLHSSGTAITELPSSIQFLTNLRDLRLNDCKKLSSLPNSICELKSLKTLNLRRTAIKELPELPPSLKILWANECESLEIISSSTLGGSASRLHFANCFKLDQKALMEELQLKIKFGKIANSFGMVLPGSEIPQWFTYQSTGSSITIQFPSNTNLKAFAFCSIFHHPYKDPVGILGGPLRWEGKITGHEYDNTTYRYDSRSVLEISESYQMFLGYHNDFNTIFLGHEVKFETNRDNIEMMHRTRVNSGMDSKVKMCGVHLIYENPDGLSISDEE